MNKPFRCQGSYHIEEADASSTLITPQRVILANFLGTPFEVQNTSVTSTDDKNFSAELSQIKTEVMALKSFVSEQCLLSKHNTRTLGIDTVVIVVQVRICLNCFCTINNFQERSYF